MRSDHTCLSQPQTERGLRPRWPFWSLTNESLVLMRIDKSFKPDLVFHLYVKLLVRVGAFSSFDFVSSPFGDSF